jgi:hypothetical protein
LQRFWSTGRWTWEYAQYDTVWLQSHEGREQVTWWQRSCEQWGRDCWPGRGPQKSSGLMKIFNMTSNLYFKYKISLSYRLRSFVLCYICCTSLKNKKNKETAFQTIEISVRTLIWELKDVPSSRRPDWSVCRLELKTLCQLIL